MNGGVKFLACTALLTIGACGGEQGKLEIRSMPTPLAQGKKPVSFRVAEGHQQMSFGNVALALESYRRALQEDPNSVDAHAGIGAGYDRMGRFDLSRRSYEAALAIEPNNTAVLAMLAVSLEQQGKRAEALAVRMEIKQRLAAAQPAAPAKREAPVAVAAAETVDTPMPAPDFTASLPVIATAPLAASVAAIAPVVAIAAFTPDEPEVETAPAAPKSAEAAHAASSPALAPAPTAVKLAEVAPAQTVTVKLPEARPAKAVPATTAVPKQAAADAPVQLAKADSAVPAPSPEQPKPRTPMLAQAPALPAVTRPAKPVAALPVAAGRGPRLERTSLGEVALLTTKAPQWASMVVKQDQRSATVRFVPLRQASARLASVRLLNAARVQGLAARTRSTLFNRGWRAIAIGDAGAMRQRSLVLYPSHRRATAMSLARQFGFATAERASGKEITVLLGRDAALMARRLPSG
jgi:hypothetical protein